MKIVGKHRELLAQMIPLYIKAGILPAMPSETCMPDLSKILELRDSYRRQSPQEKLESTEKHRSTLSQIIRDVALPRQIPTVAEFVNLAFKSIIPQCAGVGSFYAVILSEEPEVPELQEFAQAKGGGLETFEPAMLEERFNEFLMHAASSKSIWLLRTANENSEDFNLQVMMGVVMANQVHTPGVKESEKPPLEQYKEVSQTIALQSYVISLAHSLVAFGAVDAFPFLR